MDRTCGIVANAGLVIALVLGPQTATVVRADDQVPPAAITEPVVPAATVVDSKQALGVLGRAVRDAADEDMGRVVDVIVDSSGHVLAAVIDFGGFLGVGSRKIAVDWDALRFGHAVKHDADIRLELTRDQLKAAPEYKADRPLVVIGTTGTLKPLNFPTPATPEK